MDAQDDGLHDDEEHGDAGGGAARGASCLNMNPMRMALPVAGGAPPRGGAQRTRWSATADHVAHVVPALHASIAAAGGENGRHVVLALKKQALVKPEARQRPRLRTRALGDELEAIGGARSRGCAGTAALHARRRRVGPATAATISHPWRDGAAPRGARRPLLTRRAQVCSTGFGRK